MDIVVQRRRDGRVAIEEDVHAPQPGGRADGKCAVVAAAVMQVMEEHPDIERVVQAQGDPENPERRTGDPRQRDEERQARQQVRQVTLRQAVFLHVANTALFRKRQRSEERTKMSAADVKGVRVVLVRGMAVVAPMHFAVFVVADIQRREGYQEGAHQRVEPAGVDDVEQLVR
jgi:hypothetical protein